MLKAIVDQDELFIGDSIISIRSLKTGIQCYLKIKKNKRILLYKEDIMHMLVNYASYGGCCTRADCCHVHACYS